MVSTCVDFLHLFLTLIQQPPFAIFYQCTSTDGCTGPKQSQTGQTSKLCFTSSQTHASQWPQSAKNEEKFPEQHAGQVPASHDVTTTCQTNDCRSDILNHGRQWDYVFWRHTPGAVEIRDINGCGIDLGIPCLACKVQKLGES